MQDLLPIAARIGERLKARGETICVAESSIGGLLSAALLSVPAPRPITSAARLSTHAPPATRC